MLPTEETMGDKKKTRGIFYKTPYDRDKQARIKAVNLVDM